MTTSWFFKISYTDHARVLGITNADPATVMYRDPTRTTGSIQHGIEQGPVCYGIRTIGVAEGNIMAIIMIHHIMNITPA